jgi:hypothetical protein
LAGTWQVGINPDPARSPTLRIKGLNEVPDSDQAQWLTSAGGRYSHAATIRAGEHLGDSRTHSDRLGTTSFASDRDGIGGPKNWHVRQHLQGVRTRMITHSGTQQYRGNGFMLKQICTHKTWSVVPGKRPSDRVVGEPWVDKKRCSAPAHLPTLIIVETA